MRWRVAVLAGLAIAGAQAGHLIAYQLRFGSAAQQLQSTGAHAYFPAFTKTAFGVAALLLIGALLAIAAARLVAGSHRARADQGPPFLNLLAILFTLQFTWFVGQELTEALAAGVQPDSGANLLLWGIVGQLPVAAVAALGLKWLGVRFAGAVRVFLPARTIRFEPVPLARIVPAQQPAAAAAPQQGFAYVFAKRGPPTFLRH